MQFLFAWNSSRDQNELIFIKVHRCGRSSISIPKNPRILPINITKFDDFFARKNRAEAADSQKSQFFQTKKRKQISILFPTPRVMLT